MVTVARYCQKLISSNLCRGMECKEPIKLFISPRNRKKSVGLATLVTRYFRGTNQLQSMQGYGIQRIHKKIFKLKKHKKVLPNTHKITSSKTTQKNVVMATVATKSCKKVSSLLFWFPLLENFLKLFVKIFVWILFIKNPPN